MCDAFRNQCCDNSENEEIPKKNELFDNHLAIAYIIQFKLVAINRTSSTLGQVLAGHLFGVGLLPAAMLNYFQLHH